MKSLSVIILLLCSISNANGQNFILASYDPQGDPNQSMSPDAKSLSYQITNDSIIFKIDFYDRIDNKEWNISFGLDTNQNVNDGALWEGSNQSMKYDLIFKLFFNPAFPPMSGYITDASQQVILLAFTANVTDTSTLIAGLKLSDYSITKPIQFIAGTGVVFGDINDDVPDNSYVSIPTNIFPRELNKKSATFYVYPNPVGKTLQIKLTKSIPVESLDYQILDTSGRLICSGRIAKSNMIIDTEKLKPGNYQLILNENQLDSTIKFQKN